MKNNEHKSSNSISMIHLTPHLINQKKQTKRLIGNTNHTKFRINHQLRDSNIV